MCQARGALERFGCGGVFGGREGVSLGFVRLGCRLMIGGGDTSSTYLYCTEDIIYLLTLAHVWHSAWPRIAAPVMSLSP